MELQGDIAIPARRDVVYAALNDPHVLKECIPGCEEFTRVAPDRFEVRVGFRIGPLKAAFSGFVTLDPIDPPERFALIAEGKGEKAGFAQGGAEVTLLTRGAGTVLVYAARAQTGGRIARLGGRLVQAAAQRFADTFFTRFAERVAARTPDAAR